MTARSIIIGILAVLALYMLFIFAWRLRGRWLIDPIRRFNRRIFNPAMMRLAGRPHWYASVLHHKGRRSGKQYATPVAVAPIDGGFVIPLAYGERVDWLKNVLAEGSATIEMKGETYKVVDPEVMNVSVVLDSLPVGWRIAMRFIGIVYGIDRCLRMRRA